MKNDAYIKELKNYLGIFFIDGKHLVKYLEKDNWSRTTLTLNKDESFKSININLLSGLLFRHLPYLIENHDYDIDDMIKEDGTLLIKETIENRGYASNYGLYGYQAFSFQINKKILFHFLSHYVSILNKKPINFNDVFSVLSLDNKENIKYFKEYYLSSGFHSDPKRVNFKFIKSCRKDHACDACDSLNYYQNKDKTGRIEKYIEEIKEANSKSSHWTDLLEKIDFMFNEIKYITSSSTYSIRKGYPYFIYSRDNLDRWYSGEYTKLCLHCFLTGSSQFYHAFNIYCI